MTNPAPHEHVLVTRLEEHLRPVGVGGDCQHFVTQVRRGDLVRIRRIDPVMLEFDFRQAIHALAVLGVVGALEDAGACCPGDFDRAVAAEGIEHDDIVAPVQRCQAGWQVGLFVQRHDEYGNIHEVAPG